MRILLLMDPFIPVPPTHYGGIERVIYDIACQYVKDGHEVTIVAGPNSKSPGKLISYGFNTNIQSISINFSLMKKVASILWTESKRHDVIHNFGRLAWMFPVLWSRTRKVQTYMRYITPRNIRVLNWLGAKKNTIYSCF